GPDARGEKVEEHKHERPSRRRKATEHGPEHQRRKYFDDRGHDVPAMNEQPEVERIPTREDERREEGQREDAHARREHRTHVIVRTGRWGTADAAPCRRRCRGRGNAARSEEIGLAVELVFWAT